LNIFAFNWRNGDDVMWNNVIVVAMECEIMSSGNQKAILFKVTKFKIDEMLMILITLPGRGTKEDS
jgi:alpha-ketoglutarate-dependent taurine dioxygenase